MASELIFVTGNKNKLNDVRRILQGIQIDHIDFDVPEIQSLDLGEIIKHKLEFAYNKVAKPCFVMDAALSFDCLNGFPGPFIKFWFEHSVGADKTCEIANKLENSKCKWTNVLGYFDGEDYHFMEEVVYGSLPPEPIGDQGYHRDTIFIPEGDDRTFAQMGFDEKQKYAPTKKLLDKLKKNIEQ